MNKFDEKCDKLLNEKDNTKEYCKKNGIETEKNRNGDTIVVGTEKTSTSKKRKNSI